MILLDHEVRTVQCDRHPDLDCICPDRLRAYLSRMSVEAPSHIDNFNAYPIIPAATIAMLHEVRVNA